MNRLARSFILARLETPRDNRLFRKVNVRVNGAGDLLVVSADSKLLVHFGAPFGRSPETYAKLVRAELRKHARPPIDDEDVAAYVASTRPIDENTIRSLTKLAVLLDTEARTEATQMLLSIGRPAYRFLRTHEAPSPEASRRIGILLKRMGVLERVVVERGLDYDVPYLIRVGAKRRLRAVLPTAAPANGVARWWKARSGNFRWDATRDRFVAK